MEAQADIALIGLAVMGQNLILNMNDHGYTVVAFNRTVSKVDDFLNNEAKGSKVIGAHSIPEMVKLLKKPRRVMMLVKAGQAVDDQKIYYVQQRRKHWIISAECRQRGLRLEDATVITREKLASLLDGQAVQ